MRQATRGPRRVAVVWIVLVGAVAPAVLREHAAEDAAHQGPPAHEVGDVDGGGGLADVPQLVDGGVRGVEVEVFIEDGGDDDEDTETQDADEQQFLADGHLGALEQRDRDDEHEGVRRDVEDGLRDRVVLVAGALLVLDGHRPVLREGPAVDGEVGDFDYDEAESDVAGQDLDEQVPAQSLRELPVDGHQAGLDAPG